MRIDTAEVERIRADPEKIRVLHDAIDNQMIQQEDSIDGVANKIMFRRVHRGMLHAIIDMAVEQELDPEDMETAIGSAIANMVNVYLTGTISRLDIQTAKDTAMEIMDDALSGLSYLVDKVFVKDATDADPIH